MEDQLEVDEKTKSKKRDGYATGSCLPGGVAVGDSPFSTGGASQLILQYMYSVQTHPVHVHRKKTAKKQRERGRRAVVKLSAIECSLKSKQIYN